MDSFCMPFRIIELPAVPRRWIFNLFESGELFDISLCSKRMTQMIKETRTEAKKHTITMQTRECSIQIEFLKERRILIWDFVSGYEVSELNEKRRVGNVYFENCLKVRQADVGLDSFNVHCPNIQQGVCEVSKHLHNIFPGPIDLEFSIAFSSDFAALFSYTHFHVLESLRILGSIMIRPVLEKVFGNMKIRKHLMIDPDTDDEYPILQALEVEDLDLADAKWMTTEHLNKLNCRFAIIQQHYFYSKDIEAFGVAWQNNPNSRIERICFHWNDERDFLVMDGLNGHTWRPAERERNYLIDDPKFRLTRIDCGGGLDFERKSDGKLATFVVRDEFAWFLVWDERRPEKRRLERLPQKLAPHYKELENLINQYPDSCSLERLLSNPNLSIKEYVDTYRILRGRDAEVRLGSPGRACRRICFDKIYNLIDWRDEFEFMI